MGPSGSGKSSIIVYIRNRMNIRKLFSYTTREPREGELEKGTHMFVTKEEFLKLVKEGFFVEYEEIHGDYYGTPKVEEEGLWIKDIDVNGALKLKEMYGSKVVTIFVDTDDKYLEDRLKERGELEENIRERLKRLHYERSLRDKFDYLVINDRFYECAEEIESIIKDIMLEN